jgi:glycosyltransferase involved in cell wall biosynthesis
MKRIMHVITDLYAGGCEIMLLKLLSATNGKWEQSVVSLGAVGTLGPRIAELGIPVHALGVRGSWNPLRLASLIPLVRRIKPHVIAGWMHHGNLAASLASVAAPGSVPVLWNIQQSLYDISSERKATAALIRLGRALSRRPAAIIYNTRVGAKQHEAFGYCGRNRIVIPTGFDCLQFRPDTEARRQVRAELGLTEREVVVGLVARYHPMKDHAGFLKAASLVAQSHPEARFLLAGIRITPSEPDFQNLLREHKLEDRVLLLGERKDMPRIAASLDIACSASAWGEGFSNAVGEAMACGVPCVVTDVGDSAYLVADTGLAVPPRQPEALAKALSQLVAGGPSCRQQLGQAARQRIEREFSLASVAGSYEELYRKYPEL